MARSDPREDIVRRTDAAAIRRNRSISEDRSARRRQSALPEDAVVIIERPSRSATQAGEARSREWLLRFQPRRGTFRDSLTGWTGSDDPLAHLTIRFPSREAAVRYSERHGLAYEVREPTPLRLTAGGKQPFEQQPTFQLCCWPTGPHALCCGNYPALKERRRDVLASHARGLAGHDAGYCGLGDVGRPAADPYRMEK